MFNKNIFAVFVLLGSIISGNVLAKNSGLALGLHYNHNEMSLESLTLGDRTTAFSRDVRESSKQDASGGSIGLKYYFNLANIVIAPTIFADYLGNEDWADVFSATYRYGGGLDLGINLSEKFMLYVTGGVVNTEYEIAVVDVSDSDDSVYYGVGFNLELSKNANLNLEYNVSEVNMGFGGDDSGLSFDFEMKVLKAGIIFGF